MLGKDVLWAIDEMHLGRCDAHKIQGQVLREGCTPAILGATVGPPVTSDDAVRLLEAGKAARGRLPLVLVSDNGSPYTNEEVEAYLARERVLHLLNLPHTPQHNGRGERAVRDVREATGLGKGVRTGVLDAAEDLAASLPHLNGCRLRPSLGWRTAKEVDDALPSGYDESTREEVYERACEAVRTAVAGETDGRARRRKEREAILATLESFGWIEKTRGGVPLSSGMRQE